MKLSRDLCSPGSRQLLQLQLFPKFLKILDPPFNFILPRIVWITELCFCFPSATNLDCLKLKWGQLFSCFSENCFCLPMLWTVEFKVDLKTMSFDLNDFLHCYRKSIYVWIETLVLFATAVSEVKQTISIVAQLKFFWNLTFFNLVFRRSVEQWIRAIVLDIATIAKSN